MQLNLTLTLSSTTTPPFHPYAWTNFFMAASFSFNDPKKGGLV
jgi:hypothetical protein